MKRTKKSIKKPGKPERAIFHAVLILADEQCRFDSSCSVW